MTEERKGWATHRWSGWPGAYCWLCGAEDTLEIAVADANSEEDIDRIAAEHTMPDCPKNPDRIDPYTIDADWMKK